MQDQNLLLRNDTILGVCEAIGNDFGINPNLLRVGLAGALFFNPVVTVAAYVALGVPVALSRFLFPTRRPQQALETEALPVTASANEQQMLPLAA